MRGPDVPQVRTLELRHEQGEEQRRKRRVEAEPRGVAEQVAEDDADDRAAHPRDPDAGPRGEQHALVPLSLALGGHGPGLVDHQMRVQQARPHASLDPRRDGDPDREVAAVEQQRRRDRGRRGAAAGEHRDRGELRGAGERGHRHHDRREPAEAGRARQHAEGDAEGADRDRQGNDGAGAFPIAAALRHGPMLAAPPRSLERMEVTSTVDELTPGDVRRAIAGLPHADGYDLHVIPLRYRGDKPHLSAWTDFEEKTITIQIPEPFLPFGEVVPVSARSAAPARGCGSSGSPRASRSARPREVLRFLYLHEWMHWYLKERRDTKSQAETTCDRFALRNYRKRTVTLDDAREALRRRRASLRRPRHRRAGLAGRPDRALQQDRRSARCACRWRSGCFRHRWNSPGSSSSVTSASWIEPDSPVDDRHDRLEVEVVAHLAAFAGPTPRTRACRTGPRSPGTG